MQYNCPECKIPLKITEEHFGKRCKCPDCGKSFVPQRPNPEDCIILSRSDIPSCESNSSIKATGDPSIPIDSKKEINLSGSTVFCYKCGKQIDIQSTFCKYCGVVVEGIGSNRVSGRGLQNLSGDDDIDIDYSVYRRAQNAIAAHSAITYAYLLLSISISFIIYSLVNNLTQGNNEMLAAGLDLFGLDNYATLIFLDIHKLVFVNAFLVAVSVLLIYSLKNMLNWARIGFVVMAFLCIAGCLIFYNEYSTFSKTVGIAKLFSSTDGITMFDVGLYLLLAYILVTIGWSMYTIFILLSNRDIMDACSEPLDTR